MGKVVMPKNSALENEIKAALGIYYEANDWIKNGDFVEKLKSIIGSDQYHSSYTKKVQMTSYFGFTEWEDYSNPQSRRRITESGKRFYKAWENNDEDGMLSELVYSIENTVFGRNNCGCSDSDSDVEIPSIFIRTVLTMGYLTYSEFAYLLWQMEDCGQNYTDAVNELRHIRSQGNLTLDDSAKKYTDAKPIMMLIRWGLLSEDGKIGGSTKIVIPNTIKEKYGDRLSRIKIYNVDKFKTESVLPNTPDDSEIEDDSLLDEYERAARYLAKYAEQNDIHTTELSAINKTRSDFIEKFGPEKLAAITDDELLSKMFYTQGEDNTQSLCGWIEMNRDCRSHFGSISGGSAYKFGLFQRQDNGKWQAGSAQKPIDLTHEEALVRGKAIRDALVKGCSIIESSTLETKEDYEHLDDRLREEISNEYAYYNWAWFQKYFSIIFAEKLSSFHNNDWQLHILRCLGIKPSEKYYGRSGQIALVQRHGNWIYRQFFDIMKSRFGGIKQFLRIEAVNAGVNYASVWEQNSVVGVGYSSVGSLEEFRDEDGTIIKTGLVEKLKETYFSNDDRSASRKASELIRFYESNKDSIIVVMDGEHLLGMVDELGNYSYDDSSNTSHTKTGRWIKPFSDGESLPHSAEGNRSTCVQIKDNENLMFLYNKYYYSEDSRSEDERMEENTLKDCLHITRTERTDKLHPLNLIIYGAPGTGKTYSTAEYALAIVEKREVDLSRKSTEERKAVMTKYTDLIRKGQVVFTTFHQSYGYEEFIQGLRPDTKSERLSFKTVDGVFKHIADVALNDDSNNYVILIDEINRANISKVFGELITLIEEDKRWGEVNQTAVTLQSGDVFAVPNNLYIIGTMNSADKSISLIDAALRRRFEFVEQKPNPDLVDNPTLKKVFKGINNKLVDELDSADLLIGHSYFMNKEEDDLPAVLNNSIIPLLYEYFYDNKKKVASVLDFVLDDGINIELVDDKLGRLNVKKKDDSEHDNK